MSHRQTTYAQAIATSSIPGSAGNSPASAWRGITARRNLPVAAGAVLRELEAGLTEKPRRVSPKFFYDETGSRLFEAICDQPEYYLTRTEVSILRHRAREIADCVGRNVMLVEPGAGADTKARILLDLPQAIAAYVPVDISPCHLSAATLLRRYPQIEVHPVWADFTAPFRLPTPRMRTARTVVFFPGSTIGNFTPAEAIALLRQFRELAGPHGGLLIGVDLLKSPAILGPAYNDAAGVTAQFNLNLLARINREFGGNFVLANFRHAAIWNSRFGRIEMQLISRVAQSVRVGSLDFDLDACEPIVTEYCYKYSRQEFMAMAGSGGWIPVKSWTDPSGYFSVQYLERE